MSITEGLLIFITVIAIYAISVFILSKKGILKRYNISLWGPVLMWRTKKGLNLLKRIAKKERFWKKFANAGIVLCFVTMISIIILYIWNTWSILEFTPEQIQQLPGLEFALIIPVLNPLFPLEYLGYIILALIIAMIVHEFSHGILTYVSKLKVKSLGLLYLIFPIGAFCEPDEEQLFKTTTSKRMRIFAAGPTMNFVVVIITLVLFSFIFMSAVQPAADGVVVLSVGSDTPAEKIGFEEGMIITSINDTNVSDSIDYYMVMVNTQANQTINITLVKGETIQHKTVTLSDKYEEYEKRDYPNNVSFRGQGFLGIGYSEVYKDYLAILKNPFIDTPKLPFPTGFGLLWILPFYGYFQGFNPIAAPFTDSYIVTGVLGGLPTGLFWVIVNALYWIFWLNFAVAVFNVLPAVPLDGGYLFKDALNVFVRRVKKDISEEKREKIVKQITLTLSLIILVLILFPFVLKYLYTLF